MGTFNNSGPANGGATVTPHDTNLIAGGPCRGLYVGTTGNISALMADGSTCDFPSVPVGILPVAVKRVNNTGTTASNIRALF